MFNNLLNKNFKFWLLGFLIVDLFSFLAYQNPSLQLVLFMVLSIIILVICCYRLDYGLYLLFAELFVGSQGHLFALDVSWFSFSLRVFIFLTIFLLGVAKTFSGGSLNFFQRQNEFLYYYLILIIILVSSSLNGLLNNNWQKVFLDVNGWLFLAIAPFVFQQLKSAKVIQNLLTILLAAVTYLSLKTLLVLLLFAYQWPVDPTVLYLWIRDSRLGEITFVSGSYFRIFFQSQIYVVMGFLLSFILLLFKKPLQLSKNNILKLTIIALLTSTTIIACLSRSYWVGLISGLILLLILLFCRYHYNYLAIFKIMTTFALVALLEIGFLFIITNNLPTFITGDLTTTWIRNRIKNPASEAAGISRLAQLGPLWQQINENFFLGSGFGQLVTYQSNDPRILKQFPTGLYTSYAFEWGYLDIWLKIGLLGLVSYFLLFYRLFQQARQLIKQSLESSVVSLFIVVSLSSLLVVNIFSPYLNHPLGIGYLILTMAFLYYYHLNYENQSGKISD